MVLLLDSVDAWKRFVIALKKTLAAVFYIVKNWAFFQI